MGAQLMSDSVDQSKWITTKDKDIFHIDFPYPWVKGYDSRRNDREDHVRLADVDDVASIQENSTRDRLAVDLRAVRTS